MSIFNDDRRVVPKYGTYNGGVDHPDKKVGRNVYIRAALALTSHYQD